MYKLINGDCMQQELPHCRLLLTDIPYGAVNRADNGLRSLNKGKADNTTFELIPFLDKIYNCFDICVIFCGKEQFSIIFDYFNKKQEAKLGTVRQIVWAKTNPPVMNGEYVYLSGTENAVWFKKKGTGKLNCKCKKNYILAPTGSCKYHPTEKNHKLLKELILDNSDPNDLIIDTCMGSGSTGIVALENGRDFIGIELEEGYFNIAKERIENELLIR